ncbi:MULTISPECIES: oligosaccharide flippase family protein [Bacteroides]|jgi:O-antigen/teichoic acid export membrane protein|uniref:O-antigen translocase n=1 Tax=Bacteroides intestinalis TaxID=329854 RepID=A0AAQ0LQZ4_9BACE|nr:MULTISPECIES: oligosaccharide flippase family protein [Bacteroides]RGT58268.1 hypothetical protein DWX27_00710 [Bacteroides intestinalis]
MIDNSLNKQRGYRTAFKATSLFGGVQLITIVISVLKSKLIAVWLGTTGFGIMGLFNSSIALLSSITNLGLQNSAVREIAAASAESNLFKFSALVKAINRWVLLTGLLGALVTIALAPWLSRWVFASDKFVFSFALLSIIVLLTGIYTNHYALLQGTRKLRAMALANVYGASIGFLCSVPMFYFFREDGIVYALILSTISITIVSYSYAKQVKTVTISQTLKESFVIGLPTVKLGFLMALSSISVYLVQFIVKTFITQYGSLEDAGLYEAGWAINAQYLGLVFTAMSKDYYPRLSQLSSDNIKMMNAVNQQGEIAILILAPMIIALVVFLPFVINLLYSSDFLDIIPMTKWLLVGSMLKAGSWAISYVFLAKGAGKIYLFNEMGIKCITLPSYLLGYAFGGLLGIGYAFVFCYFCYFIWVAVVAFKRYNIIYSSVFLKVLLFTCFFLFFYAISEVYYPTALVRYLVGCTVLFIISIYSFGELKKRLIS